MKTVETDLETLDRLLGLELVELLEEFEDRRGELDTLALVPESPEDIERRDDLEEQCRDAESDIALLIVRTRQRLRRDPEKDHRPHRSERRIRMTVLRVADFGAPEYAPTVSLAPEGRGATGRSYAGTPTDEETAGFSEET